MKTRFGVSYWIDRYPRARQPAYPRLRGTVEAPVAIIGAGFSGTLQAINLLRRDERGQWLLARDLDSITLRELYESSQLRIPIAEEYLPFREDALGQAACRALDELRVPLRELLKRRVGDIYAITGDER